MLYPLALMLLGVEVAAFSPTASSPTLADAVKASLPPPDERLQLPQQSLREGQWVKLICGASFADAACIRNLSLVYTLAGVDCIDVAAEEAVVEAARDGIMSGLSIAADVGSSLRAPWLMISINDDDADPHFRKATFDPLRCPGDCPRPCEGICPSDAIVFPESKAAVAGREDMTRRLFQESIGGGVLNERCYGCGRCIDVCPYGLIEARAYKRSPEDVLNLLDKVEAIEIHTKGDMAAFKNLWGAIGPEAGSQLRAVAVSFPDLGSETAASMKQWSDSMGDVVGLNIWQTDGRPMSGDIGAGASRAAVKLASKVLDEGAFEYGAGQHYIQLAGGTNDSTAPRLQELGVLGEGGVGGVAYGGYARTLVGSVLDKLPAECSRIEERFDLLHDALARARGLVQPLRDL